MGVDRIDDLEGRPGVDQRLLFPGQLSANDPAFGRRDILVTIHTVHVFQAGGQMDGGDNGISFPENLGVGESAECLVDIWIALDLGNLLAQRKETPGGG